MPQRRDNAGAVCNSGDRLQRRPLVPKKSVDEQIFNSSQSTSLTFIICLFKLGHPSDLNGDINRRDHFRPGPRQWPHWRCCCRGRCWRGHKIVNFYRTEGCRIKIWRRISPGFHWYHQKLSSYVVRRRTTSRDVPDFRPIRGREIISHTHTHTHRQTDRQTHRQRIDILAGAALRAAPAKIEL